MIVKNEREIIADCLASVKNLIDYWVIVDTGSTDGTQGEIIQAMKGIPGELYERPWVNFEHNRNEALSLAKGKGDFLLFIDADERWVFSEDFVMPSLDKDCYRIVIREVGVVDSMRKCLVNNHLDWRYEGVVHEVIQCNQARSYEDLKGVVNLNNTALGARSKDPDKYLKDAALLEKALEKDPDNSRNQFYLAQCYGNAHRYQDALTMFEKRAKWGGGDPEVFWSLYCIGKLQEILQAPAETISHSYTRAHLAFPSRAEPLYRMANYSMRTGQIFFAYVLSRYALDIPPPEESAFVEQWIYDWGLPFQLAECCYYLGKREEACQVCEELLAKRDLPPEVRASVEKNWKQLKPPEVPKTIAIITSQVRGCPPWDPESIHTGVTGAEEAIIYMGEQLARLGFTVSVFGNPPEGSHYSLPSANPRYLKEVPPDSFFDIAISWRMPSLSEQLKPLAHKIYFWPHDNCKVQLTSKQIESFDDVLWLSDCQRSQWVSVYPKFSPFAHVFGNGINPEQFAPIQPRENPYSCIYGSNYAQGLEILLDSWPQVKERFPRATLDIYYGWEHWNEMSKEKEAKLRRQVAELAPLGVQEHGRVGHEELNQAYARASIWTYPCMVNEMFCITALRAQFAGCIPVILTKGALSSTVQVGYRCIEPEQYIDTLLEAMEDAEKISLQEREAMRGFILGEFTWEALAKKWKELFEEQFRR